MLLRHPLAFERPVVGAMKRLIRPGDTVFDVGANIGVLARFWMLFGAKQVLAFEPMARNRQLLERNIRLGRAHDRIRLMPFALGEEDGQALLQTDDVMSATAALDRVTHGAPSEGHRQYHVPARTESVRIARLDTLVERGEVPPPDVIKVDVEGAEAMVLRGATRTLEAHAPRLVIELHGLDVAREVVGLLHAAGYRVYGFVRRGTDGESPTYEQITEATVGALQDRYDLHHVFASRVPADVETPVEEYRES